MNETCVDSAPALGVGSPAEDLDIPAPWRTSANPPRPAGKKPGSAPFLPSGQLETGVNYWASHAGVFMWRDWQPDIVRADLSKLAAAGLHTLRVFPLWPDFQPLDVLRAGHGREVEFRHGEEPLFRPDGLSEEMLDRFEFLADTAAKKGLKLIVALITGWMSGRFFAPPALAHLNAINDPVSLMWQARFIKGFVGRFTEHEAIAAWDLGNECNCMGRAAGREEAWLWTALLTKTIRATDPSRPVISGMHSLSVNPSGKTGAWTMRDQGELTDILTTHPYPPFTPHCHREPPDTMRPLLHAGAETCLYADLSGRPAFVEELGTLGPQICDEETMAFFLKIRLFDLWAHDCRGLLWWCAFDQTELTRAPYDWMACERELGIFRADGSAKPAVAEFRNFHRVLETLPFRKLPPRRIDAVCILTDGQDNWGVAYSAFVLAKQSGFDIRFVFADQTLPEAGLYLLPSVKGLTVMSRRQEEELWKRVESGSSLYISFDEGGGLGKWHRYAGARIVTSSLRGDEGAGTGVCRFSFEPAEGGRSEPFEVKAVKALRVASEGAEVLAAGENDVPVLLRNSLGRGEIFSLLAPIEAALAGETGAFSPEHMQPFWKIYREAAAKVVANRWIQKIDSPWIGVTEHEGEGERWVVLVNYARHETEAHLRLSEGVSVEEVLYGPRPGRVSPGGLRVLFPPGETAIWKMGSDWRE